MSDDLYDRDVLARSERQAVLPRRAARGEGVNDIDWVHVAEEIEDGSPRVSGGRGSDLFSVVPWPDQGIRSRRRAARDDQVRPDHDVG